MSKIIIVFLAVYFISFFGLAVVWRNYAVAKKTGANAFKLNEKIGAEAITGLYFKFLPLVSILVFTLYAFLPTLYQWEDLFSRLKPAFEQIFHINDFALS